MLNYMPPTLMAEFLYIGAGIGMILISFIRKLTKKEANELKLSKVAMIILDIIAPFIMIIGVWLSDKAEVKS